MSHTVITSYFTDLNAFDHLFICDRSFKEMLELVGWESVLSIEEYVYPNLVKAFYSNIELSVTTQDKIVTNVGGVPVEFDIKDLIKILGTENEGLKIYTSRKELFSIILFMLMRLGIFVDVETFSMICAPFPFTLEFLIAYHNI